MKKNIINICFFIILFVTLFFPISSASAGVVGDKIADVGASLAVGTNGPYYAEYPGSRVYNWETKKYVDARERNIPMGGSSDGGEYASCDVGVATIIRESGADQSFEPFLVPNQWRYLNGSSIWQRVGTYYKGSATGYLKPGDVLVVDPDLNHSGNDYMHIWLYLGNEAVRKYHPNSNCDAIEASYNSYRWSSTYPSLFTAGAVSDSRPYAIFRYSGPDTLPGEKEIDRSGGVEQKEFTCEMLCDPEREEDEKCILDYISQTYIVIEIVAIAIYLFMNIWTFTQAVSSTAQDKFKKLGKKMVFRTIALVVVLLLPIFIKAILSLLKTAGVNQIIDFCIDQFL